MREQKLLSFVDITALSIVTASLAATCSLALGQFTPLGSIGIAVALSAGVTLYLRMARGYRMNTTFSGLIVPALLLLLLAAAFRLTPYDWTAGGQDQGVYTNMSRHFQTTGEVFVTDEIRKGLPADLQAMYDATNYALVAPDARVAGRKEGSFLPGLYIKDVEKSQHVFQFYHVHPLWMAIAAQLFGDDKRTYSLLLFSLISVLMLYLLAFELTGSRLLAAGTGALLALNPLHAYLSKFPVTEVVALAFSSLSFYYLVRYYNLSKSGEYPAFFLVLSALSMACLFFTRISGFMYVPFFYLLLLSVEVYTKDAVVRKQLRLYVIGVFLLYSLSVLYGLAFSYPYASDIYRLSFTRALGGSWQLRLTVIVGGLVALYPIVAFFGRAHALADVRARLLSLRQYLPLVFLAFLLLGAYKAYQLGFTTALLENPWYGDRWGAAGTGAKALLYWSPLVLFEYLSPFIGLLFCYVLITTRKTLTAEKSLLLMFLLFFFAYICVLQWFIPYQYYYARYLLSEVLPYMLLFTVIGIAELPKFRKTAYVLLVCAGTYMLLITSTQFRGEDMGGFKESVDELAEYVTPEDILIVDQRWMYSALGAEIKTPLIFHYDFNVVSSDINTVEPFITHYCSDQRQFVYYLSIGRQPGLGQPHKLWRMSVEIFEKPPYIPTKIAKDSLPYYLYKVSCPRWLRSLGIS
jgi:hypothetical protein